MDLLERLFLFNQGMRRYNKKSAHALTGTQLYMFVMMIRMDSESMPIDTLRLQILMKINGRWPSWPVIRKAVKDFESVGWLIRTGNHRLHVTEAARKEYKRINTVLTEARIRTKKSDTGLSRRGRDRAAKLKKPLRLGDDTED